MKGRVTAKLSLLLGTALMLILMTQAALAVLPIGSNWHPNWHPNWLPI
jgi:hypothetical protein